MHWNLKISKAHRCELSYLSLPLKVPGPSFTVGKWKLMIVLPLLCINSVYRTPVFPPPPSLNLWTEKLLCPKYICKAFLEGKKKNLLFSFQIYMSEQTLLIEEVRVDCVEWMTLALSIAALGPCLFLCCFFDVIFVETLF